MICSSSQQANEMKHWEDLSRNSEMHMEIKTCFHILLAAITTILTSFLSFKGSFKGMFKKLKNNNKKILILLCFNFSAAGRQPSSLHRESRSWIKKQLHLHQTVWRVNTFKVKKINKSAAFSLVNSNVPNGTVPRCRDHSLCSQRRAVTHCRWLQTGQAGRLCSPQERSFRESQLSNLFAAKATRA